FFFFRLGRAGNRLRRLRAPFGASLQPAPVFGLQREPVQNPFLCRSRLRHCHDALIVGGSPTLKTHPQEPPSRVGRKRNGKGGGLGWPSAAEARLRFVASVFAVPPS